MLTNNKLFFFGFSRWKHKYLYPFLQKNQKDNIFFINPIFSNHYSLAIKKGLNNQSKIFFWGSKSFPEIEDFAKKNSIKITRVEDGFIRSISLGSDLTKPYSLVFDNIGIYYDTTRPSEIENKLNHHTFSPLQINKAKVFREKVKNNNISKYNNIRYINLSIPNNKKKILIPGQVDSDASLIYGGCGFNNLKLLKQVRQENPEAYIIFKPHPDVLSGNRKGQLRDKLVLKYCNLIIKNTCIASVLRHIDEVHTITSLSGLEGLLYGKKVITYGKPFYGGWGLTIDKQEFERRNRKINLDYLIAIVYMSYPTYLDPYSNSRCTPLMFLNNFSILKKEIKNNIYKRSSLYIYSKFSRYRQKFFRSLIFLWYQLRKIL